MNDPEKMVGDTGIVVEVKIGGWRTILLDSGLRMNRRSGSLEYADGAPSPELVEAAAAIGVGYAPRAAASSVRGGSKTTGRGRL